MNKEKAIAFLEKLGIDTAGVFEPERYILEIDNSDDYARYYTVLDQEEGLDLIDVSSMSTEYSTSLAYKGGGYKISLNANFTDDYYTLTLEEK